VPEHAPPRGIDHLDLGAIAALPPWRHQSAWGIPKHKTGLNVDPSMEQCQLKGG
jgi:hypothetical protein